MTVPIERSWAIENARQFLLELLDPKKTPRVPMEIRKHAARCLKHFPGQYDMDQARKYAPNVFGSPDEN